MNSEFWKAAEISAIKSQYEEDCKHSDKPWQWWEQYVTQFSQWFNCTNLSNPMLSINSYKMQRKPDAPVWDKQWSPEGKRLINGDKFEFFKYIADQEYPILGIRSKNGGEWWPDCYKESDFEEIPKPCAHIKKGDPVAVKSDHEWIVRIFSHVGDNGKAYCFNNGHFNNRYCDYWDECLTIEEYNKLHGDGNDKSK